MKRREFLYSASAATAAAAMQANPLTALAMESSSRIDRRALVRRHLVVLEKPDALSPLTVGNGELGFSADVTGLQIFPEFHEPGMPLHTMAQWAWHDLPNPHHYTLADTVEQYDSHGRSVPYPSLDESPAGQWLMSNPHRFDLVRLGFKPPQVGGRDATIEDLQAVRQTLDIWKGILFSNFTLNGRPFEVETVVHPDQDLLAIRVTSPLLKETSISMEFPGSIDAWKNQGDFSHPETHTTKATLNAASADFVRQLDGTTLTYVRAA